MEAAASIVGLLAVAAQIYTGLHNFTSTCIDAPMVAQVTCDEVNEFRYVLEKLQPYVDGSTAITLLGASMTDVNHLSVALATCVNTFSRLEKMIDKLIPARGMDIWARMKWARAEPEIGQLVQRLQQHKSSLQLLLTIWIRSAYTHNFEFG